MILDRTQTLTLLEELASALADRGLQLTIHIVGGAALMLTVNPERVGTTDVDAWINCGAHPEQALVVEDIVAARPEVLFAMKLRAGRGRRDFPDVAYLLATLDISTRDAALARYDAMYPHDPIPARSREWLERYFGRDG